MYVLILLLRWFSAVFGLTTAKPQEEARYALFLFGMLLVLAAMLAGAVFLLLLVMQRSH